VDDLIKELEQLREENKILRDSLTDRDGQPDEENGMEKMLRDVSGMIKPAFEQAKENLRPGADKVTEALSKQMEENPVPLLIAAFGLGYLFSRSMDRK